MIRCHNCENFECDPDVNYYGCKECYEGDEETCPYFKEYKEEEFEK